MKQKDYSLEGLRGLASLAVVIGHFSFAFVPYLGTLFRPYPGAVPWFLFDTIVQYPPFTLFYSADAAVCIFFTMSGYVLSQSFFVTDNPARLSEAAAKRYLRLAIPTFVAIAFAWVLQRSGLIITSQGAELGAAGWIPSYYDHPISFRHMLFSGVVGAPLFGDTALNGPVWTIQVELIGSMLLFAYLALNRGRSVFAVLWFLFFANVLAFKSPNVLFYLLFLAGASLHRARPFLLTHQRVSVAALLLGLVFVSYNEAATFSFLQRITLPNLLPYGPDFNTLPRVFWHSLGSVLLVAGVIGAVKVGSVLSGRWFVYLGRVSFSMYLLHMPIIMSFCLWSIKIFKHIGFSYGFAVTLTFAWYIFFIPWVSQYFYRFVDAPATRFAARIAARTRTPTQNPALQPATT